MTLHTRVYRAAAGMLLLALAALVPADRAAAETPTLDEVYQRLGVDKVSADYVVLIDTSLSMNVDNLYGTVRERVRQFLAALAPEDGVTLVSVADDATLIWEGKAGKAPDDIVAKLPPAPTGNYTDLGKGIAAAVEALEKRLSNPIASVVLLTDGKHDPPPGSYFPFTEGYAWQQLTERAGRLKQRVNPYAIQLRGANGAALLKKVFPSAHVVGTQAIDQLTARLAEPKAAVQAAKARSLVTGDLKSTVVVDWPPEVNAVHHGTNVIAVRLRSTSKYLPLEVTGLAVRTDSPGVQVEVPPGPFTLSPGASTTVPVTVRWDAGPSTRLSYRLQLSGKVGSPWSAVLASRVGVAVEPSLANTEVSATASTQRGNLNWWLVGANVMVALLLLGLPLRWLRLHPVPGGTLVANTFDESHTGGSIPLRRRRVPINASSLGIPGAGTVSGRRRGMRSERVLSIEYSKDGSVAGRKVHECPAGGSVDVDDVRFEWRG